MEKTEFEQDFEKIVREVASEIYPPFVVDMLMGVPNGSIDHLIRFAKRFYDMGKEG